MRPGLVIVLHPRIQLFLRLMQRIKHSPRQKLCPQRPVKAFNFPRRGSRIRGSLNVFNTVPATDLLKQHLHRRGEMFPGEYFAVIGQNLA